MDKFLENSCCRRPLFAALHNANIEKTYRYQCGLPKCDLPQFYFSKYFLYKDYLFKCKDLAFLTEKNPILYLQLASPSEITHGYLSRSISDVPRNIGAYLQKIALLIGIHKVESIYGALMDSVIELGGNGNSIRQRILAQTRAFLAKQRMFLSVALCNKCLLSVTGIPVCRCYLRAILAKITF